MAVYHLQQNQLHGNAWKNAVLGPISVLMNQNFWDAGPVILNTNCSCEALGTSSFQKCWCINKFQEWPQFVKCEQSLGRKGRNSWERHTNFVGPVVAQGHCPWSGTSILSGKDRNFSWRDIYSVEGGHGEERLSYGEMNTQFWPYFCCPQICVSEWSLLW